MVTKTKYIESNLSKLNPKDAQLLIKGKSNPDALSDEEYNRFFQLKDSLEGKYYNDIVMPKLQNIIGTLTKSNLVNMFVPGAKEFMAGDKQKIADILTLELERQGLPEYSAQYLDGKFTISKAGNSEGFTPVAIEGKTSGGDTLLQLVPLATTVVGGVGGYLLGKGKGAALGSGAGAALGEGLLQARREQLENQYTDPDTGKPMGGNSALDIALAAGLEPLATAGSTVALKGAGALAKVAKAVMPVAEKAEPAFKKPGPIMETMQNLASSIGKTADKAADLIPASNPVKAAYQGLLNAIEKNSVLSLFSGVDFVKQAGPMITGKPRTESEVLGQLDEVNKKINELSEAIKAKNPGDINTKVQEAQQAILGTLKQKIEVAHNAFTQLQQAKSGALKSGIEAGNKQIADIQQGILSEAQNALKGISDQETEIGKAFGLDFENLSKSYGEETRKLTGELEQTNKALTGLEQRQKQITGQAKNNLEQATTNVTNVKGSMEAAQQLEAKALKQTAKPIYDNGAQSLKEKYQTPLIEKFRENKQALDQGYKEASALAADDKNVLDLTEVADALKGQGIEITNPQAVSVKDAFKLLKRINSGIEGGNKNLITARRMLVTDEDSVFKGAADISPAIENLLSSNLEKMRQMDLLQSDIYEGLLGKKVSVRGGSDMTRDTKGAYEFADNLAKAIIGKKGKIDQDSLARYTDYIFDGAPTINIGGKELTKEAFSQELLTDVAKVDFAKAANSKDLNAVRKYYSALPSEAQSIIIKDPDFSPVFKPEPTDVLSPAKAAQDLARQGKTAAGAKALEMQSFQNIVSPLKDDLTKGIADTGAAFSNEKKLLEQGQQEALGSLAGPKAEALGKQQFAEQDFTRLLQTASDPTNPQAEIARRQLEQAGVLSGLDAYTGVQNQAQDLGQIESFVPKDPTNPGSIMENIINAQKQRPQDFGSIAAPTDVPSGAVSELFGSTASKDPVAFGKFIQEQVGKNPTVVADLTKELPEDAQTALFRSIFMNPEAIEKNKSNPEVFQSLMGQENKLEQAFPGQAVKEDFGMVKQLTDAGTEQANLEKELNKMRSAQESMSFKKDSKGEDPGSIIANQAFRTVFPRLIAAGIGGGLGASRGGVPGAALGMGVALLPEATKAGYEASKVVTQADDIANSATKALATIFNQTAAGGTPSGNAPEVSIDPTTGKPMLRLRGSVTKFAGEQ